ncbi:MAG: hypothetical protein JXB03_11930 [Spirochaetales bacterium]|nr:hypothetical protein [Spirochaetales bacterium]
MGTSKEEKHITKAYLLELITQYKLVSAELKEAEENLALWEQRMELAKTRAREDLAAGARLKIEEYTGAMESIRTHHDEISREIRRARSDLKILSSEPELSIDPDALYQSLEAMGGKSDPLLNELEQTQADEALKQLKQEMGETQE